MTTGSFILGMCVFLVSWSKDPYNGAIALLTMAIFEIACELSKNA